ncbi:sigma-54-dependent Fis family transcriptional regulator [Maledivibacter halophilus]|uniref:PAS domain S-box-containing protein n=1 Tax=Maledivibacter halophilus TaxID=36842 RepID=A0A1T5MLQ2_9FIRM|nr:sigma 54-interacting transcriptional regulator [Maledivibacter halophilus]SKC88924.1 PAS domain S-box-containing protein [Maledivibacter halophilus]
MPTKDLLSKNINIYKQWEQYVKKGKLEKKALRNFIADSWIRSKNYGIDPFTEKVKIELNEKEINKRYEKFKPLLKTAKPFMNSLHKIVGNSGLLVRLTDKDGYVLECIGDMNLFDKYGSLNIYKGCNVKEEVIGTNAIGTALYTKKPVQVIGAEHFCKQYHGWSSSACPIRNNKGEIIGILSMTGPYEKVHSHTLGMIVASAEAIEKQLKLDLINKQLEIAIKHFHAIMESISDGLICINTRGIVTDINLFARKKLLLKEKDIIGKSIKNILFEDYSDRILKAIKKGRKFEEEEIYFKLKRGKKLLCIANITPINELSTNKLEGVVITFNEAKVIHSLVNKIVGAKARFKFNDILGESPQIKDVIELAKRCTMNDTTVLLKGESGTGKELFAQSIHNASLRKNKPFIFLNCGAIPRELVASELFGYVEGAFTGAKRGGHTGKFELADEGSIFLDEIGDMPLDAQTNLLRVLETREVVRVGGHEIIPVDVRVIAATHKDLEKEVELGNFRKDLYYRLNVMPINIPPLRERKEDIKLFIDYFIKKYSAKMNKKIEGIHDSFYRGMMSYNWPGNVRELQNVMQQIINIVDNGEILSYNNLPDYMKSNDMTESLGIKNKLLSLEEVEKITIERTVTEVDRNIALASRVLGISRSSLYRKIYKYGLQHVLK